MSLILGIETSCDDTGVAIINHDGENFRVMCDYLSSQIKDHAKFGGVIPEFAARKHLENLLPLVKSALECCEISGENLDLICVTRGPGLMGSLIVGVQTARALSQIWHVPLIGVNHLEGHLFAPLINNSDLKPPFLSLIVSGGHTEIILVRNFGVYEFLGETRDDAAGEAYDKAAKILGLPYPGGPEIDKLAKSGDPEAFKFPVPLKNSGEIEFSFSGLKTALLWQVRKLDNLESHVNDLCASFQKSVIESLIAKVNLAVKITGVKDVAISGGVCANSSLRENFVRSRNFRTWLPEIKNCTDNAVMIALAGCNAWRRGVTPSINFNPDPSLHKF